MRNLLLLAILGVLLVSCSVPKNVIGHYGDGDQLASTDFIISSGGAFSYKFTGEGFGRKEWSFGVWTKVNDNEISLYSIRHDSLPVRVWEEKQNIEDKIIVLPKNDAVWRTNASILINGQPVKISKDQCLLFLSSTDFPEIKTISVQASISDDDVLVELANYTNIKTSTYNVQDSSSSIFYVTFPFPYSSTDLFSCFYLKELNDTIIIRRNKLIWNGYKYPLNKGQ